MGEYNLILGRMGMAYFGIIVNALKDSFNAYGERNVVFIWTPTTQNGKTRKAFTCC